MAWRGGHAQPLRDPEINVFEREPKLPSLATSGLVRLVEDAEVKAFRFPHASGDDACRLVRREDHLDPLGLPFKKCPNCLALGGDGEIDIGLVQDQRVSTACHRGIGTDAEE